MLAIIILISGIESKSSTRVLIPVDPLLACQSRYAIILSGCSKTRGTGPENFETQGEEMSKEPGSTKPNRMPWIVAGALGCLAVCLVLAVAGAVGYLALSGQSTPVAQSLGTATRSSFGIATMTSAPVPATTAPTSTAAVVPSVTPAVVASATSTQSPPPAGTSPTASKFDVVGVPTATSTRSPFDLVGVPTSAPSTAVPPTAVPPPATKAPPAPTAKPTASASNYLIAFSKDSGPNPDDKSVWIMNSDGSGAVKLFDRTSHPILKRDGNQIVVYHWTDGLWLINASDPQKVTGSQLVADTFTGGDYGSGDWSHDGRWIAFTKQPGGKGNIVIDIIAPDKTQQHTVQIGESASWSPDDTMLAFHTCRGANCGIYKGSVNGGDAIPIVTDDGGLPAWSPDGNWIVYQRDVNGQKQLFLVAPDGSGNKQLTSGPAMHVDANWSPDGNYILYRSPEGGTWAIWRMNIDGSNKVKLIDNVPPVNWPYERLSVSR